MTDGPMDLSGVLDAYKSGTLTLDEATRRVEGHFFKDLGHSTIDSDRARRTGSAEVIYGEHKTPEQIGDLMTTMIESGQNVLVTRTRGQVYEHVRKLHASIAFHEAGGLITCVQTKPEPVETRVAVVTAGTSDLSVSEEAAVTAEFLGSPTLRINDVGVAGIHRLLARADQIRTAKVLVVVAGMEGALPSVVGGLVDKPVIAVPTSVGYGAAFGGVAALLGMLNSCASGVSVVNIDNGFGAGYLANMINRL